ncbi:MAG: glycosyltransferase [Candidatus Roizmanbacteria bacterium]
MLITNNVFNGKKVGLYNPFLDTLGGGEKHILSILQVFAEKKAEITIFWDKDLSNEFRKRFSLHYINIIKWNSINSIFSSLKTLQTLKTFDYFFYVTDGSYFFSSATKNFVFCMVPDKKLYNLNFLNRLKLWNYKFISNSPYTTKWLNKWGIDPITIPPFIDNKLFINDKNKKEKVILSVGRFFPHLHSKNQEKIIETFKLLKLSHSFFKDYKLILAGGLKNEDRSYFNQLKSLAKDSLILFKPNASLDELYKLYELSTYFWHFTGLGIDEEKHPERVEHFGIAPLEAIASGCLTFCHNSGGPKEIIRDGKTGFLFYTEKELIGKMEAIEKNNSLKEEIIINGKNMVQKGYNYEAFKEKVLKNL